MKNFFEESGEQDYFSSTRETMGNRSIEHYHMHFLPGRLQGKFLRCMLEGQGFPITAEVQIKK
jgi:diadenosine tetraphosphate (Ap4A) HIT family hydrolase